MAADRQEVSSAARNHHERDYIERTIATVRNHRDADNCWPQWANIFADEIERLWEEIRIREDSQIPVIPHGAAVQLERLQVENEELRGRLKLACEPCAECGHIDWRELDDILEKP